MDKIIILEGCDKTGKSTLAKLLAEQYGYKIKHFGVPEGDDYCQALLSEIKDEYIVFDRFHWGDWAYAGITTELPFLSVTEFAKIENALLEIGCMVIYCKDSTANIKRRMKEDGEKLIKPEDIPKIVSNYKEIMRVTKLPVATHQIGKNEFNPKKYDS